MTFRIATLLLLPLALTAGCGGDQKLGVYNSAPVVSISSPPDGTSVNEGDVVTFQGLVSDAQTPSEELIIGWSSDIAGIFLDPPQADSSGLALYSNGTLTPGNHAITLAASDEAGERSQYTIVLTVMDVPDAPEINVVHPGNGESGQEGEAFNFVVQVTDEQDAPETLVVSFESDVDGVFCTPVPDAIGVAECEQSLSPGDHRLTFEVTDSQGLPAREEYYFTVVSASAVDDDDDGWTEDQGDCDDGDASVNPNASEYYNGRDDDCDGVADNGTVGYDDDADGQSELDGDCDDTSPVTYEGATESCDGVDNDCDSIVDETTTCYDDDGDGLAESVGDCNDASAVSYPGAPELEDGTDNDCDGTVDEGTNAYDDDFDGYTENAGDCDDGNGAISPAATESCNGSDDDCDGTADERDASGCFDYYYDYDGDGYGSDSVSSRCLCSYDGYYTAATNTDCYDYNSGSNPTATTYSTSSRGDGSFDWDCDSSEEKYYAVAGGCTNNIVSCPSTAGWAGGIATCGSTASYVTSCSWDWFSCDENTSNYTQKCL
ncbi:MAG: putative metal-binding motif-containing protein [Pseudomonadota bacterium]|nr:putative metal-binding motif-containing protein [Pseudomonadota bacterium]